MEWLPIIFTVLILPGVFLTFIPLLPAIPYMFLVALIFAFLTSFEIITWWIVLLFAVFLILSFIIDQASGIIGAKYGGASKKSILFGLLGFVIGFILFPPFGGILGLFAGVVIYEFLANRQKWQALKAGTGYLLGAMTGILINFSLAIIFFIIFVMLVF